MYGTYYDTFFTWLCVRCSNKYMMMSHRIAISVPLLLIAVNGFSVVSTRRSAIERTLAPLVVTTTSIFLPPPSPPDAIAAAAAEAEGGTSNSKSKSETSSTPISASWTAVDGLNTLDSSSGKFVSFDESAYLAMVNDKSRTPQFEKAIVDRLNSPEHGGPSTQVVLDLGTGPYAYFALVAARAGAGKVYAIEASGPACISARAAVKKAGCENVVTIIEGYSTDVTLPGNVKVDFAIAEIVGSIASEEGVLATISDARERLVDRPDDPTSWIPRGVQTLAAPASYSLHNLFVPPAFDWAKLEGSPVRFNCRDEGLQLLSDPVVVEDVRFADMGKGAGTTGTTGTARKERRRVTFEVDGERVEANAVKFKEEYVRGRVPDASTLAISAAGSVTGIALWPRLILDDDVTINSRHYPDGDHQRSHWQTVLPIMSPVPVAVRGGDEITVDFDFVVPYAVTTPPSYRITGNVVSSAVVV
jgi:predicted RNA methylase